MVRRRGSRLDRTQPAPPKGNDPVRLNHTHLKLFSKSTARTSGLSLRKGVRKPWSFCRGRKPGSSERRAGWSGGSCAPAGPTRCQQQSLASARCSPAASCPAAERPVQTHALGDAALGDGVSRAHNLLFDAALRQAPQVGVRQRVHADLVPLGVQPLGLGAHKVASLGARVPGEGREVGGRWEGGGERAKSAAGRSGHLARRAPVLPPLPAAPPCGREARPGAADPGCGTHPPKSSTLSPPAGPPHPSAACVAHQVAGRRQPFGLRKASVRPSTSLELALATSSSWAASGVRGVDVAGQR